ncbi:hypothetical protein PI124_g23248 [Phytophthora idaei]|nr:hypothetical protein PI125_g26360 [Phytophthora idaei]KAG3057946.1 hypothetical protein PI125_g25311 [Phytophthora idaei]KAG3122544.1 hypothetical protein PI126_g24106 [Phytophthora idaei]KAG3124427.1 hypothetical protein PI126_g23254 [Phytophthora idaei]KAG3230429.1 hypothetical protein PI124_g24474 [Phytophthora idaei]
MPVDALMSPHLIHLRRAAERALKRSSLASELVP